jgi:hypothetical protein
MITPASLGDWATFAGLLGSFGGIAAVAGRWIHHERVVEREAANSRVPMLAQKSPSAWRENARGLEAVRSMAGSTVE